MKGLTNPKTRVVRPPVGAGTTTNSNFGSVILYEGEEVEWNYRYNSDGTKTVVGYTIKNEFKLP